MWCGPLDSERSLWCASIVSQQRSEWNTFRQASCFVVATKPLQAQKCREALLNRNGICQKTRRRVRIRLTALPKPGELDEFDLRRFRIGEVYDLPPHLATLLLITRCAELAPPLRRDSAADSRRPVE